MLPPLLLVACGYPIPPEPEPDADDSAAPVVGAWMMVFVGDPLYRPFP